MGNKKQCFDPDLGRGFFEQNVVPVILVAIFLSIFDVMTEEKGL